MSLANIHMPSLMKQARLTIRVTGRREIKVRIWICSKLMKLASWILGAQSEIQYEFEGPGET